jgi:hypothetical protein
MVISFLLQFQRTAACITGILLLVSPSVIAEIPIRVNEFVQDYQIRFSTESGLPSGGFAGVKIGPDGKVFVKADAVGVFRFDGTKRDGGQWSQTPDNHSESEGLFSQLPWYPSLSTWIAARDSVRDVAEHAGEIAVATKEGLFVGDGTQWQLALPNQGNVRWAPMDVRAVAFDGSGQLWFAAPQGVGCRLACGQWRLYTGSEGLPYNDFTCMAAGPDSIWFGTTNGAIKFSNDKWYFRQGGRWLLDNHVRDIAVDGDGDAWFATPAGVSCIANRSMTLASKAEIYEQEIERYHRRTSFGYVNPAVLSEPGDKSSAKPKYSDNDGFNTGLYLAANSFAYSVTRNPKYKESAVRSFRALQFLSEVTQGGEHSAPKGFIARNVVPITEANPNEIYSLEYDIGRQQRDSLWKIMRPRVPIDKTGQWYWKCDSSSDELDGHFFGYAIYFDHVCETEEEKQPVRQLVRDIMEHILTHDYSLVDHDGRPTRWARFSPKDLNERPEWVAERGMNSIAILTFLSITHHITGDEKYREEFLKLAFEHGYGMNGMSQYKWIPGSHSPGHQPGDNLTFMNYYHLLRYEADPRLLSMFNFAISRHWSFEKYERNAFTNFIYAACCRGKTRVDNWREEELSPPPACYQDAVETLRRYPLDLVEWPMSNAHRIDMLPLEGQARQSAIIGSGIDGTAFPIDERHETYWDWDPWKLSFSGEGKVLRPGFHYLLAYYLGRYHDCFVD